MSTYPEQPYQPQPYGPQQPQQQPPYGYQQPQAPQPQYGPPQPPQQKPRKKVHPALVATVLALLAILVILIVVIAAQGGDETADPVSDDRSVNAEIMCEQFIEKRLKAPATAEYTDPQTTKNGATYTVVGAVDSQNSFGAQIRTEYACVVRDNGDDTWTLVDLTM